MIVRVAALPLLLTLGCATLARAEEKETRWKPETFSGLGLRGIGPAAISGRISEIAVHPTDPAIWWIAAASGGVWKTVNAGTTWAPIFDGQGSYSIGALAVDAKNPLLVWVGTGENNSQRSVSYGDGLYRSSDGGASWEKAGLGKSEHIARILIDPRDSRRLLVAAQGPLWSSGGERGLYETLDSGKTWKRILHVDDDTGVTDVVRDPRDPDVLYAASYQRRRHVWTLIDGGPGSAIWKSTDGGANWKKLEKGLGKENDKDSEKHELGRIGLAIAPSRPDWVYAIVEADGKAGGVYRTTDGGGSWDKRSDYVSTSPQYYQRLVIDPKVETRVYSLDTFLQISEDGGKTFKKLGEKYKHVDNHALYIDPKATDHLIAGCDGGLYETWDRAATWRWFSNLPLAQFYKVAVDEALPFYNVFGGSQDNNSLGGPSRTPTAHGIVNADWFITVGGDGFQSQVDPSDPNIVYAQSQHGVLGRFDRRTGEALSIQPQPDAGEPPLRWNWDSPLLHSIHGPRRLYFAANRVFRTDDRGNSWTAISPDLTRQVDRNKLKVMGRVWSVDAVAKNNSTSFYGNIVALAESPVSEQVIAAGTDDGLVQVTEDGGKTWRKHDAFKGVPDSTYVSRLLLSRHDPRRLYAAFDNHQMGDYKPYVLQSDDLGNSWRSIAGNLPERGTVYALAEDHVRKGLLFAGTEFGLYFTIDGGAHWLQLKGGLPVIQVRDLAIQRRENDLVAASFGRGFYILDDYTPLRTISPELLEKEAVLFAPRTAPQFVPSTPLGGREKASQGDAFFTAPNPPHGVILTWYLRDELVGAHLKRRRAEQDLAKKGNDNPYPSWDALKDEDREEESAIVLTVTDEAGAVVRRITAPGGVGLQRASWDLRYPPLNPIDLKPRDPNPWDEPPQGPLTAPGTFHVQLARRLAGKLQPLGEPQKIEARPIYAQGLGDKERAALLQFERKTGQLQRAALGAVKAVEEAQARVAHLEKALPETTGAGPKLIEDLRALKLKLLDLNETLTGNATVSRRNEPTAPSIVDRVQEVVYGQWNTTVAATATHQRNYQIAAEAFAPLLEKLQALVGGELVRIEKEAEAAGAPWTPGRLPTFKPE